MSRYEHFRTYELGDLEDLICLDYGYFVERITMEPDTDPDQDPRLMAFFKEMVSCAKVILTAERVQSLQDHRHCHNHYTYLFFFEQCDTFDEFQAVTERKRM